VQKAGSHDNVEPGRCSLYKRDAPSTSNGADDENVKERDACHHRCRNAHGQEYLAGALNNRVIAPARRWGGQRWRARWAPELLLCGARGAADRHPIDARVAVAIVKARAAKVGLDVARVRDRVRVRARDRPHPAVADDRLHGVGAVVRRDEEGDDGDQDEGGGDNEGGEHKHHPEDSADTAAGDSAQRTNRGGQQRAANDHGGDAEREEAVNKSAARPLQVDGAPILGQLQPQANAEKAGTAEQQEREEEGVERECALAAAVATHGEARAERGSGKLGDVEGKDTWNTSTVPVHGRTRWKRERRPRRWVCPWGNGGAARSWCRERERWHHWKRVWGGALAACQAETRRRALWRPVPLSTGGIHGFRRQRSGGCASPPVWPERWGPTVP